MHRLHLNCYVNAERMVAVQLWSLSPLHVMVFCRCLVFTLCLFCWIYLFVGQIKLETIFLLNVVCTIAAFIFLKNIYFFYEYGLYSYHPHILVKPPFIPGREKILVPCLPTVAQTSLNQGTFIWHSKVKLSLETWMKLSYWRDFQGAILPIYNNTSVYLDTLIFTKMPFPFYIG